MTAPDQGPLVALDPAYLPGILAAEAELERVATNEKSKIWEAGFRVGFRTKIEDLMRNEARQNPYEWRGK